MKILSYIAVFMTFWVVNCGCSRHGSETDKVLNSADNLMHAYPDSALKMLRQLEGSSLNASDKARYALLLTKAQTKSNEFIGSDSIIKIAYDYYDNRNDSMEMQSRTYYGEIQYYNGDLGNSLVNIRKAYDMANEQENPFYAGLNARIISAIYGKIYESTEELKWAKISKQKFEEANASKHAAWADITLINSLISLNNLNAADSILLNIDSTEYNTEPVFRHSILKAKADIANAEHRYVDAIKILMELYNDGYKFKSLNWCKLSDNYYRNGEITKSQAALDSAKRIISTHQENLYCKYMESLLLAQHGNYRVAASKAIEYGEKLENEIDNQINSEAISLLEEYLTKDAENAQERATTLKFRATASIIILALIIIIAIGLIITLRLKNQRDKAEAESLRANLKELGRELETIRNNRSESKDNTINYILSLDAIYEKGFKYLTSKQIINKLPTDVREVLEAIRNDENIDILNKCIDSICEEWIIKFTKTFTSLEQFQYQLAKYLHLNISPQMIAMLMKRNTLDAVYNLKSRLKKRLKADNPEAAEHYIREIFSKREIKNLSEFKAREEKQGEKEEDCRERHDETAHGAGGKGKPETFHGVAYEEGDKSQDRGEHGQQHCRDLAPERTNI